MNKEYTNIAETRPGLYFDYPKQCVYKEDPHEEPSYGIVHQDMVINIDDGSMEPLGNLTWLYVYDDWNRLSY